MRVAALLLFTVTVCSAQSPQVPHKLEFAGMTLTIRDDARREIQKDVDAFTQSPKHFAIKADRAKTYFPIIERIFAEERVPDDFKFLVLQESALIADAVSSSNAVGFWQFKDFTAMEMGLRVDKEIDERMNIVSATRAAAKYIKKNNFYFNNWLYALQAYQMGAGGVMQQVKDYQSGTRHMEVTSRTYWYVKKFLAHKIAYEHAVKGTGQTTVHTIENKASKSLADIAKEFAVNEEELRTYNKWIRKERIPDDRAYTVLIPSTGDNTALAQAIARANDQLASARKHTSVKADHKPGTPEPAQADVTYINGVPAVLARSGETITALAARAGVDISLFLKCNDASISDVVMPGVYYFTARKNAHGQVQQYTTSKGESLWTVSQKYAVQLRKLKKYNRQLTSGTLPEGTVVALTNRKIRKTEAPAFDPAAPVVEVSAGDSFNWSVTSSDVQQTVTPAPVSTEPVVTPVNSQQLPTNNTTMPAGNGQHVVAAGETLYAISKRYGVGVMDLVGWNALNLETGIREGQVLTVKAPASDTTAVQEPQSAITVPVQAQASETVYEVKASDTLYSVARRFGVSIKEIMDWNQKKDFNLSPGEKLRILKKM